MDEFIIVLGIALVLLAVMFVAIGPQSPDTTPGKPTTNITTVAEIAVGPVGFVSSAPASVVEIKPFAAGTTQSEELKNWGTKEIVSGLFDNKEVSEPLSVDKNIKDYLERVVLEFDVNKEKSNSAEDLVVQWNGVEVFRGKPTEGHQAIRIPKENVTDSNTLKVSTSAPGISSIVKSTTYVLDNLNIAQEYGQAKIQPFDLSAKDLEVFEKGEINFAAVSKGSETANISIKINGIELYNKKPDRFVLVAFDQKSVPNLGINNRISILSQGGFFEVSDAKINLYLLTTTVAKKRSFLLNSEQMKNLEKRILRLEIEAASTKPGKLSVNINNKTFDFTSLEQGINSKDLKGVDLVQGENTIEFTSTGSFEIPKARIVAE